MRSARVLAQAKVNLILRVGARDDSGYHVIATLFHRLDLADSIAVRLGGSVRALECVGPQLPARGLGDARQNLAYRAAVAYAERASWIHGFAIELTKNIPVGGGLGGGSADAGAVLRALDALAPPQAALGAAALHDIAFTLGSDVPFLASESVAAVGHGRGERLQAVDPLPRRDVLLVVPDFGIATADAYRWLDADRPTAAPPTLSSALGDWDAVSDASANDFESVVESRHPELRRYREALSAQGARIARLAGSGSSVFGVFEAAAPGAADGAFDALVVPTRTSARVVQVEVLE